jgi:O-antigen/teichoic acid export membrane protein
VILQKKIKSLLSLVSRDNSDLTLRLIKAATGSFGIRILYVGLTFILSLILARLLETKGFGIYTYAISWLTILSIPATLGLDKLLIREISKFLVRSDWGLLKGILSWANLTVLLTSVGFAIIACLVAWFIYYPSNSITVWAIWLALAALPIYSLVNIRMGAMKGFNIVVISMMPELLIPLIQVFFAIPVWSLLKGNSNNVLWILGIRLIAIALSFILGAILLYRAIPLQVKRTLASYQTSAWLKSSLPFMFLGATEIINTQGDILMLGAIKGVEVVGIYGVVSKISTLVIFIQGAANNALGPTIARFYAENKTAKLRQLVIKSTRMVLLVSLVFCVFLIVAGKLLLSLFGSDFVTGYESLVILTLGQFIGAAIGPVGLILNMTGYERFAAISIGFSAILNVILNAILIPKFGINGAAFATAASITVVNIANMFFVKRKLSISSVLLDVINPKITK